jgi:uncharacterized protein (TIGR03435 family)
VNEATGAYDFRGCTTLRQEPDSINSYEKTMGMKLCRSGLVPNPQEVLMKRFIPWFSLVLIALIAVGVAFAQGQDLTGQWQGTLHGPGRDLRVVIKVTKGDDGALKAMFYSIDQGGQGIGVSSISLQGSTVKFSIVGIGGTYQGELAAGGGSIKGTWTQGPAPAPLDLDRVAADAAWAIPAPPKPMTATDPSFEVATIKLTDPNNPGKLFTVRAGGRQVVTIGTTMNDLIAFAYGMHPKQVINGPDWFDKTKFDITGQPDAEGIPSQTQMRTMLQKLLVSRFQLTFHKDTRELSVFEIVVGKDGPKLTPSGSDPSGLPGLFFRGLGNLVVQNATMTDFAGLMQSAVLDKPVVDHTGLKGKFDFTLKWTADQSQFEAFGGVKTPPTDDPNAPPDLYTAIQQQIGLKINTAKASTDVMVIDKVEQPSPN